MFVAAYRNTMRNAKFHPRSDKGLQEARRKEQERLEMEARAESERKARQMAEIRERMAKMRRVFPRDILRVFCHEHGITMEELLAHSRKHRIVYLRDKAIRLVRDARPDMSLPALGRVFDRDHTTIIWSLKKTSRPEDKR